MLNLFNFIFSILNNKQKLPFKMSKMQHTMISKCEEVFVRNDSCIKVGGISRNDGRRK